MYTNMQIYHIGIKYKVYIKVCLILVRYWVDLVCVPHLPPARCALILYSNHPLTCCFLLLLHFLHFLLFAFLAFLFLPEQVGIRRVYHCTFFLYVRQCLLRCFAFHLGFTAMNALLSFALLNPHS